MQITDNPLININEFTSYMPTRIIFGQKCVTKNKGLFKDYNRVFIVTGKHSAKKSGAFDDIISVLKETGKEWTVFDKIMENPLLSICHEGGREASKFKADLILGIGGGSPIDASKAIALFAANPTLVAENIFNPSHENTSLPIFAIPTTAGTGSEVNPYSVLSLDGEDVKKTFNHVNSYPKVAFLDVLYTMSLSKDITISTALDAFCHCIESYLSPKSTPLSSGYAVSGFTVIWNTLKELKNNGFDFSEKIRERLLFGSLVGGLAINATGTGFPHPLGYNLTFEYNLPHGKACAVFIGEYLRLNKSANSFLCETICSNLNADIEEISAFMNELTDFHAEADDSLIEKFTSKIKNANNFKNSHYVITDENEIKQIYKNVIGQ